MNKPTEALVYVIERNDGKITPNYADWYPTQTYVSQITVEDALETMRAARSAHHSGIQWRVTEWLIDSAGSLAVGRSFTRKPRS